jgi:hypothetical protein
LAGSAVTARTAVATSGSTQPYAAHLSTCAASSAPASAAPRSGSVSSCPGAGGAPAPVMRAVWKRPGAGAAIAAASVEVLPSRTNCVRARRREVRRPPPRAAGGAWAPPWTKGWRRAPRGRWRGSSPGTRRPSWRWRPGAWGTWGREPGARITGRARRSEHTPRGTCCGVYLKRQSFSAMSASLIASCAQHVRQHGAEPRGASLFSSRGVAACSIARHFCNALLRVASPLRQKRRGGLPSRRPRKWQFSTLPCPQLSWTCDTSTCAQNTLDKERKAKREPWGAPTYSPSDPLGTRSQQPCPPCCPCP